MIRAHAAGVLGLLRSDAALTVYDGLVPNLPTLPYVVLWTAAPVRSSDRLCGSEVNADAWFQTSAVGRTADQVRAVQEHVMAVLLDSRIAVPGRAMARLKHTSSQPIQRDDSTTPPVFLGADQWSVFSAPGPV